METLFDHNPLEGYIYSTKNVNIKCHGPQPIMVELSFLDERIVISLAHGDSVETEATTK